MPNYRLPTPRVFNPRTALSEGRQFATSLRPPLTSVQGPRFPGAPRSYAAAGTPLRTATRPPLQSPPRPPTPPRAPAPVEHAASLMGPKSGVTPRQVQEYMRPEVNRGRQLTEVQAAAAAAADNIWAEQARRLGVLTGNAWEDDLIWREHWAFNQGLSNRDPLLSGHPEALKTIEARALEALSEQRRNLYNALVRQREMTRRAEGGGPAYVPPAKQVDEESAGDETGGAETAGSEIPDNAPRYENAGEAWRDFNKPSGWY
jgi:hypothetical protein